MSEFMSKSVKRPTTPKTRSRRNVLGLIGASAAAAALPRYAFAQAPAAVKREPVVLKFAFVVGPEAPLGKAFAEFARLTAARTNNDVTIQLFPNAQLGGDLEVIEQIRLGAPMLTLGYDAALEQHIPDFGAFFAAYLFPSWAAAQKFYTSDFYRGIAEQTLPKAGVIFECRNLRTGWRHWINKVRAFNVPDDMKGLRLRATQTQLYLAYVRACGAVPIPMGVPELYTSLQQGIVDGVSSPMSSIRNWKLYESAKFFSLTHHVLATGGLFGGKFFVGLPKDLQKIMIDSYSEAAELHNRLSEGAEAEDRRFMESQGVKFNDVDPKPFVKVMEPVYEEFKSRWSPGLIDKVRSIIG